MMKTLIISILFQFLFYHEAASVGLGMGLTAQRDQFMADFDLLPDAPVDALFPDTRTAQAQPIDGTNITEHIVPEYVTLPLDHFGNSSAGTFKNRFWVAESGYRPGGPVFIWDVGESNASPTAVTRLQGSTSIFKQIVDQFGGIGIVWEHRFYGNSTPYPINLDTPASSLRYLTTAQALADIPFFAANFSRPHIAADLTPHGTPWIMIGGSYSGARAAFTRSLYPSTIFAAYASSAPVQAQINMSAYFDAVHAGLVAGGFANCTADIHAAVTHIDTVLALPGPGPAAQLKRQFLGRNAGNNTNAGFADALATIFNLWQAYGVEGGPHGLRFFCDWLSTDASSNTTSPAEGWAATKGAQHAVDRWARWPFFAATVNDNLNTACEGPGRNGSGEIPGCELEQRYASPGAVSWTWQACSEWGFFQVANVGERQLVSGFDDLGHQREVCRRQFPGAMEEGWLPEWPKVEETNRAFGGWDVRPSRTIWSGGEFDPWRALGPLREGGGVVVSQGIPGCEDVSAANSSLFGYVMPNAEHLFDFRTTFPGGEVARKYFTDALTEWLKCWNATSS